MGKLRTKLGVVAGTAVIGAGLLLAQPASAATTTKVVTAGGCTSVVTWGAFDSSQALNSTCYSNRAVMERLYNYTSYTKVYGSWVAKDKISVVTSTYGVFSRAGAGQRATSSVAAPGINAWS